MLNSRHPDLRRVWKGGSGARLLPPLCRDPRDPRDPGENNETSVFDNPSVTFEKYFAKRQPKKLPQLKKSPPVYTKRLLAPRELFQKSDQNNFIFQKSLPVYTKPLLWVVKSLRHEPALPEILAYAPFRPASQPPCYSQEADRRGWYLKRPPKSTCSKWRDLSPCNTPGLCAILSTLISLKS